MLVALVTTENKLVKTRLRSQLGDDTLYQAMRVCIEGPERLNNDSSEAIIDNWREPKKPCRLHV